MSETSEQKLPVPSLRTALQIEVKVAPPAMLGALAGSERRFISILGGSISGPGFSGSILPGGCDVQRLRPDGTIELAAQYAADLGPMGRLLIENTGIRRNGATPEAAPYFRGVMRFQAPEGSLQWLNDSIFICTGMREMDTVYLQVMEVA